MALVWIGVGLAGVIYGLLDCCMSSSFVCFEILCFVCLGVYDVILVPFFISSVCFLGPVAGIFFHMDGFGFSLGFLSLVKLFWFRLHVLVRGGFLLVCGW